MILGSLSNHDDDGNKNPTNLHIWQRKTVTVFLHALHVYFFIFWHFEHVLVLSTTWNDLFCSCVDDVSLWWQLFNFVFLCLKRWFQLNFWIVRTHFTSIMSLNNWKMIAEMRSHIFRWGSRFRRRRVCLSSLLLSQRAQWIPGFVYWRSSVCFTLNGSLSGSSVYLSVSRPGCIVTVLDWLTFTLIWIARQNSNN